MRLSPSWLTWLKHRFGLPTSHRRTGSRQGRQNRFMPRLEALEGRTLPSVVLSNPGDQSNNEGDLVSWYLPYSADPGDPVTFSIDQLPEGLAYDAPSGLIGGYILYTAAETTPEILVTVVATQ